MPRDLERDHEKSSETSFVQTEKTDHSTTASLAATPRRSGARPQGKAGAGAFDELLAARRAEPAAGERRRAELAARGDDDGSWPRASVDDAARGNDVAARQRDDGSTARDRDEAESGRRDETERRREANEEKQVRSRRRGEAGEAADETGGTDASDAVLGAGAVAEVDLDPLLDSGSPELDGGLVGVPYATWTELPEGTSPMAGEPGTASAVGGLPFPIDGLAGAPIATLSGGGLHAESAVVAPVVARGGEALPGLLDLLQREVPRAAEVRLADSLPVADEALAEAAAGDSADDSGGEPRSRLAERADGARELQALVDRARGARQGATLHMNDRGSDLAESFGRIILQRLNGRESQFRLFLNPPHLGHMQVRLAMRDSQVQVAMRVDTPAVKHLLHARSGELQQMLAAHGVDIEEFTVDLADPGDTGGDPGAAGAGAHGGSRRRLDPGAGIELGASAVDGELAAEELEEAIGATVGLIDMKA